MDVVPSSPTPYLTGKVLLAMPGMGDPRFQKAVIFICAHDANGAMGLVANHPLPGLDLGQLLRQMKILPVEEPHTLSHVPVLGGGPVESARGFVLHSPEFRQSDTIRVNDSFSVTGTIDCLRAIAAQKGPRQMLFMLGYAGWSAGQLDREMQDNAWLVANATPEILFATPVEMKWNVAIRTLGIDPTMLSGDAGHA